MLILDMTHKQYADSLRQIADFFEQHTDISLPHNGAEFSYFTANSKKDAARLIRALGACKKEYDTAYEGSFVITKMFGDIQFMAVLNREAVCERKQVGTRPVPETILPAREEQIIAAHEEPVYEWRCSDSAILDTEE